MGNTHDVTGVDAQFVAVVPLRAGSKGLPGKNTRELAGRPLYAHSVEHGLTAGAAQVLITTDVDQVLRRDHGTEVVLHDRAAQLCRDDTPMDPVLVDVLSRPDVEHQMVVLLQPTSPLRRPEDILACLDVLRRGRHDVVMTVCETDRSVLKYGTVDGDTFTPLRSQRDTFSNRQDLPTVVRPNGAVFAFRREWLLRTRRLGSGRIGCVEMPSDRSLDIDTNEDFARAAAFLVASSNSGV